MTGMQRYNGEHLGSAPHRCARLLQSGQFRCEHARVAGLRALPRCGDRLYR